MNANTAALNIEIRNKDNDTYRKISRMARSQAARKLTNWTNIDSTDLLTLDTSILKGAMVNYMRGLLTAAELTETLMHFLQTDEPTEGTVEVPEGLTAETPSLTEETDVYSDLYSKAAESVAQYAQVRFSLIHRGDGVFQFGLTGPEFTFTDDGFGYMLYRLNGFINIDEAWSLYIGKHWNDLVKLVNDARNDQRNSKAKAGGRLDFVQVMLDGKLMSLLTTYKPVANTQVLDAIKEAGLTDRVKGGWVTDKEMTVYIRSEAKSESGRSKFGVVVINGQTGHRALAYRCWFNIADYDFTFPARQMKRHLGTVYTMADQLNEVYGELINVEVEDFMMRTHAPEAVQAIRERLQDNEKVEAALAEIEVAGSVFDYLLNVIALRNTKGFKTVGSMIADAIMAWAFETVLS